MTSNITNTSLVLVLLFLSPAHPGLAQTLRQAVETQDVGPKTLATVDTSALGSAGSTVALASSFGCRVDGCQIENAVLRYAQPSGVFDGIHVEVFRPHGLALHALRETLLVVSREGNRVLEVDAVTGGVIRSLVEAGPEGLVLPQAILFTPQSTILVTSSGIGGVNGILEFDGETGAFVREFVNGGDLLSESCGETRCLRGGNAMTFGPNGNLFVTSSINHSVIEYNAFGQYVSHFDATQLIDPVGLVARPFGTPDAGNLLVASLWPGTSSTDGSIIEFDIDTNEPVPTNNGVFVDLGLPAGPLAWASDGNLLVGEHRGAAVASLGDQVNKRSRTTGAVIDAVTASSEAQLHNLTSFLITGVGHANGDADGDGDADLSDIAEFMQCFGQADAGTACTNPFDDNVSSLIGYHDWRVMNQILVGPQRQCDENADCDDQNDCTLDTCSAGTCVRAPVQDGSQCGNGLFCDGEELCYSGICLGSPPCGSLSACNEQTDQCFECITSGQCDDQNPCTDDVCIDGTCEFFNNTSLCDDADACTLGDTCMAGTCQGTTTRTCNDGNVCTTDSCSPEIGCLFVNNTGPCDDGSVCSQEDRCLLGVCRGADFLDCNDDNPCTTDTCDPFLGCRNLNNSDPCSDGELCTTGDTCQSGVCLGLPTDCDDEVACTVDSCDQATGECINTPDHVLCDDGEVCTDNECTASGCVTTDNTAACDDGMFCTASDQCSGGICAGTGDPCSGRTCDEEADECLGCLLDEECDDGNPCTDDACVDFECQSVSITAPCDDGLFCTPEDSCSNGSCVGSGERCPGQVCDEDNDLCVQCLQDADCDDGNVCTDDACDGSTCSYTNNTSPCNDGLFCTETDVCANGACGGSGDPCPGQQCDEENDACVDCLDVIDCSDANTCTDDACVDGTCVYTNNKDPCDDGLFCTAADQCVDGTCVGSGEPDCDDSIECTFDFCDMATDSCAHGPVDAACNDLNECTDDICTLSGCIFLDNSSPCDDGDLCTENDVCSEGACAGTPIVCPNEGLCDPLDGICKECVVDSNCDDGNGCTDESCVLGTCTYTDNTNTCDDGDLCTESDVCSAGTCSGSPVDCGADLCDPADGLCKECLTAADCSDGDVCTDDLCTDGICENPNNASSCDDGDLCTENDTCSGGVCAGTPVNCGIQQCDPADGLCKDCLIDADCDDANVCTDDACVTGVCQNTDNTEFCDDGDLCTENDTCSGGVCTGTLVTCPEGLSCDPADGICK